MIKTDDFVKFVSIGKECHADEIGVLKLDMDPRKQLSAGNVGYIISGIKTLKEVKVGDTITHVARPCDAAIDGFKEVKLMVFAGVYPIDSGDFENLRALLEKLQLNDASLHISYDGNRIKTVLEDADPVAVKPPISMETPLSAAEPESTAAAVGPFDPGTQLMAGMEKLEYHGPVVVTRISYSIVPRTGKHRKGRFLKRLAD